MQYDITKMFTQGTALLNSIETKAVDASEQAEVFLRDAADWIAATRLKLTGVQASPVVELKARELLQRCEDVCPCCQEPGDHAPKHLTIPSLPGNPILTLVLTFFANWLKTILPTTTPNPAPSTS